MTCGQVHESHAVGLRYPAQPPVSQALVRKRELPADNARGDCVDQRTIAMKLLAHERVVSTQRLHCKRHSFIHASAALLQSGAVTTQSEYSADFGERLKAFIKAAGFRSARAFAIHGLGWSEDNGPQRLANYIKGRKPDLDTLIAMAKALRVSVQELLGHDDASSSSDESARGILLHLLSLEGIDPDRADTIANVFLEAQRLYRTIPGEESPDSLARFSAHAAWLQYLPRKQDT